MFSIALHIALPSKNVTQCYSTGDVEGKGAGDIAGSQAGYGGGSRYGHLQESYSTGDISGDESGGLAGNQGALSRSKLRIVDCYTRGNIFGSKAGGITGHETGGDKDPSINWATGTIIIERSYAAGATQSDNAGGVIGGISNFFEGSLTVESSVYKGERILGANSDLSSVDGAVNFNTTSNSFDDIQCQLYQNGGDSQPWVINNGTDSLPVLKFQLGDEKQAYSSISCDTK